MARMADVRNAYARDKVTTTPERLVTMLYDRLVRDLVYAEQALTDGDREVANRELQHAQDIVMELVNALDIAAWPPAEQLQSLYLWIMQELINANLRKDAARVRVCRDLVEPLAEAWHAAAGRVADRARPTVIDAGRSIGAAV